MFRLISAKFRLIAGNFRLILCNFRLIYGNEISWYFRQYLAFQEWIVPISGHFGLISGNLMWHPSFQEKAFVDGFSTSPASYALLFFLYSLALYALLFCVHMRHMHHLLCSHASYALLYVFIYALLCVCITLCVHHMHYLLLRRIIKQAFAGQLNSFTHLRALLVLYVCIILCVHIRHMHYFFFVHIRHMLVLFLSVFTNKRSLA
jgi:hypothetical protein